MRGADWRLLIVIASGLTGCSLAPRYKVPEIAIPGAYKEPAPWTAAQPSDAAPRGEWWKIFNDEQLDALQQQLTVSNQNLKSALARYEEARADAASALAAAEEEWLSASHALESA